MSLSGKKLELRRRRGELTIFIVSLLLAFFIWLAHNLTQDYFSYRQFRVTAVTSIPGFSSTSEAQEILSLGGYAKGFNILNRRRNAVAEIPVRIDPKLFTPDPVLENTFSINARDIQEQLAAAVGTDFQVTNVPEQKMTFVFLSQSFRKVPVTMPEPRLSFAPQYMQVGEISVSPDSVLVYGNTEDIDGIRNIETLPVHLQNLDNTTGGKVFLREVKGLRYGDSMVNYQIRVERYVEMTVTVKVAVVNAPIGTNVLVFPSRLKTLCRVPFASARKFSGDDLEFEVDYGDIVASHSSKIVPKLVASGECPIFSYETEPALVDCIISEHTL